MAVHNENSELLESTLILPANMLVRENQLTFEFIGHYALKCEDPSNSTLWSHIDTNSSLEFSGSLSPLQDELKLLPAPFYDSAIDLHPVVPIVFLTQPSPKALQAAGIIASWFGILADSRPVRFPVSVGTIPTGNAIVIGESRANLPHRSRWIPPPAPPSPCGRIPPTPTPKSLSSPATQRRHPYRRALVRFAARPSRRLLRPRSIDQDAHRPPA